MTDFVSWKNEVLGKSLNITGKDPGECSQVSLSWALALFPGHKWSDLFGPVKSAEQMFDSYNKEFFTAIKNDHSDVHQLPQQGDIMFFNKPLPHTGVCDSAGPTGYTLVQQNAPREGALVNDTSYPWNIRNCTGWVRPKNGIVMASTPPAPVASSIVGLTLHLPKSVATWRVYNVGGPYDTPHAIHQLAPARFGGLDYPIQRDLGNGIYVIHTENFGDVAIWTHGTVATIS